mgnify:CR=1 FL=1
MALTRQHHIGQQDTRHQGHGEEEQGLTLSLLGGFCAADVCVHAYRHQELRNEVDTWVDLQSRRTKAECHQTRMDGDMYRQEDTYGLRTTEKKQGACDKVQMQTHTNTNTRAQRSTPLSHTFIHSQTPDIRTQTHADAQNTITHANLHHNKHIHSSQHASIHPNRHHSTLSSQHTSEHTSRHTHTHIHIYTYRVNPSKCAQGVHGPSSSSRNVPVGV